MTDKDKWNCKECIQFASKETKENEICTNCKEKVEELQVFCYGCRTHLHYKCSLSVESYSGMGQTKRQEWRCPPCRGKPFKKNTSLERRGSGGSIKVTPNTRKTDVNKRKKFNDTEEDVGSDNESDEGMKVDGNTENKKDNETNEKFEIILTLLQKREERDEKNDKILTKIQETLETNERKMKDMEEEIDLLKAKVNEQEKEIKKLKEEKPSTTNADEAIAFRELEQYNRNKNAEVHNVPWKENEDLREIVVKIAEKKGVQMGKGDIDVVHRFSTRAKTDYKPIIVQFTTRTKRDEFISWKEGDPTINQKDIMAGMDENEKILIFENLSPFYKDLRYKAKQWGQKNGFNTVKYRDYRIIIKKNPKEKKYYWVKSERGLEDLSKKIESEEV